MGCFQIHVDASSLQKSSSGQITGTLFVETDGRSFPENSWNDFVVIVLQWWLQELASLQNCGEAKLRFMDGPFWLAIRRRAEDAYAISYSDDPENSTNEGLITYSELDQSIRLACESVIGACYKQGWSSSELHLLQKDIGNHLLSVCHHISA